jgi:hypothetical protein
VTQRLVPHLTSFADLLETYQAALVAWGAGIDTKPCTLKPGFAHGERILCFGQPLLDLWPELPQGHQKLALIGMERHLCAAHRETLVALAAVFRFPDLRVALDLPDGLYDGAIGQPRSYGVLQMASVQMGLSRTSDAQRMFTPFTVQAKDLLDRVAGMWSVQDPQATHHPTWHVQDVMDTRKHPMRMVCAATWQDALRVDEALHWCQAPAFPRRVFDANGQPAASTPL